MVTVNEEILNRAFAHATTLDRFTEGEVRKILRFLNRDVFPDLLDQAEKRLRRIRLRGINSGVFQTQRYLDMIQEQQAFIKASMSRFRSILAADMRKLATTEAGFQARLLKDVLPFEFNPTLPDARLLRSIVTARPMQTRLLREWSQSLETSTRAAVRGQINIGLAQGETIDQMVRRIRGTRANAFKDGVLQLSRRNAEAIVRTAVSHTTTHARSSLYAENTDVIKGEVYRATLDTGTTHICISLDGREFPVGEGEHPPMHMQCRSDRLPLIKSFEELGIPGKKEFSQSTRESLDGQVPQSTTYDKWLARQPIERQIEVLGVERARLFRDGRLDLRDLTDNRNRPLTLEALRAKLKPAA